MSSAYKLRQLFNDAAVRTNAASDDAVFERIRTTYTRTVERNRPQRPPRAWRSIMKRPATRLAIAAVILIACAIGLSLWKTTGSGIALANVLAQVQQTTAYMFQTTVTITGRDPIGEDMNETVEGTTLISQDYGMKMVMDSVDPNGEKSKRMETYMLLKEKTLVTLMHDSKLCMRAELSEAMIEGTRREHWDLSTTLKQILDCTCDSLGRSTIDGVEVEGFHTTDPNSLRGITDRTDMKVWINIKTQLPVRLEMDGELFGMRTRVLIHNIHWDYPVDANTFRPVIPLDYVNLGELAESETIDEEGDIAGPNPLDRNEERAILGLKMYADLIGRYPETLDPNTFDSFYDIVMKDDPIRKRMQEDEEVAQAVRQLAIAKELTPEERTKRMNEVIIKKHEQLKKEMGMDPGGTQAKVELFTRTVWFYEELTEENKDPAYFGDVVTPEDVDKVLMRWKVSDNQYRVIFGSLHAETVDAATLAELEKDPPK